jgi:hypothetical protein
MAFVQYVPDRNTEEVFRQYFLAQAEQTGFGGGSFSGTPYQRGHGLGSMFSGLLRSVFPLFKSAAKAVGKTALKTGLAVASDALHGRDVAESFKDHGRAAASELVDKAQEKLKSFQSGEGLGMRPHKHHTTFTHRKKPPKKKPKYDHDDIFRQYN